MISAKDADGITAKLRTIPAVATVEQVAAGENTVQLTAFPKSGALLIEEIGRMAADDEWNVKELYAEPGRLDEVFRAITTHDAARAREGRA
jgi:ABC-2 type transport system ATP-binding protein